MTGLVCLKQRSMMQIFNIINWQGVSEMVTDGKLMESYIERRDEDE
jgi:hypothetical protein